MSRPEDYAGITIPITKFEDTFSEEVWRTTYKDHKDNDINDTLRRVARYIASAETKEYLKEKWEEQFYNMLSEFKCTVGGRIYANAGTNWEGTTLHNCYVAPRDKYDIDSMEGILKDVLNQCQTLKSEGGWGQNFSWIRPRGAFIRGIGVESPGAVKYMEIYDKTSDVITAGSGKKSSNKKAKGKIRKGAQMAVLDCWHPDVIEFITAKQQSGRLTKFNMSVNCTDEFMQRVLKVQELQTKLDQCEDDQDEFDYSVLIDATDKWPLRFPDTTHHAYKDQWDGDMKGWEAKGFPTVTYREVSVTWLWNLIMESTYNRAEPGVLFLDRANYFNPAFYMEKIVSTNPCGEQVLSPGNICCLGSINLTQFLNQDTTDFDYEKLARYTKVLVRFLDNVNSLSKAPLPEYEYAMRKKRRVGVGILGWGSVLFMLKVRFGSKEANKIRKHVMSTVARSAYEASIDLAEEKGMFDLCVPEKHAEGVFVQSLGLPTEYMAKMRNVGIRNSSLLSVQPTGNTSILANVVSGGLEPIFMPEYIRTVIVAEMPDHIANVTPKWFEGEWYETPMFKLAKEGDEDILKGTDPNGVVYKIDKNRGLTKEVLCQDYGVRWLAARNEWDPNADWAITTTDLTANDHLEDLKGFTRWIDSSASKTINVPHDYSFEDFKNVYLSAYQTGYIKGVTTYRAGTMTTVLAAKDEKNADDSDEEIILDDVKLRDKLPATLTTIRIEGKKWYLTTVMNDAGTRPVAFFVHTNVREHNPSTFDAVDYLLDLARTKGIPEKWIDKLLRQIGSENNPTKIARCISLCLRHGVLIKNIVVALDKVEEAYVGTFVFQIKKYLASMIRDGEKVENEKCQECGGGVVYSEGCKKCISCGSSKCG